MKHSTHTGFSAHDSDEAESDYQPYESMLLQVGKERSTAVTGCQEEPCSVDDLSAVDLYCRDHDRLIPLSRYLQRRGSWIPVNLLRGAVCGAVVLAAGVESSVPLFILFVLAGLAIVAGPLYRFPVTMRTVIFVWLLAGLAAGLLPHFGHAAASLVRTIAVVLTLVLAMLYAGALAWREQRSRGGAAAPAVTVAAFTAVPALAAGWFLASPSIGLISVPDWVRHYLPIGVATGVAATLLVAAIAGAVGGQARVNTFVAPLFPVRREPWLVNWRVAVRRGSRSTARGAFDRALAEFAARATAAIVATARGVANMLLRAAHIALVLAVRLANWICGLVVVACRRLAAAVRATAEILAEAALLAWAVGWRTARVVVLPVLMLSAAAAGVAYGAIYTLRYLLGDGPGALGLLAVAAAGSVLALTVAWIALCDLPIAETSESWRRSVERVMPHLVVTLIAGAWVVGIPGTLGHGPIKVGSLTITSTVLLFVVLGVAQWRNRGPADTDETSMPAVARAENPSTGGG
ncbi:hypothetical protein [Streptomyces sp. SID13031]|uniref:hypothetical protein n=1 Tax=Streptomyces sp. SID13031 TaxID=2706046 RepID=UPI0013CCD5D6|nr:hypothetical protein [Streptomyces sp. SID13031]NEA32808.1 hypothetical protein [Streptomyces sp. SID13031]